MNETLNNLLDDESTDWWTASENRPAGPFSSKQIIEKLQSNQLSLAAYLWREGQESWQRIYEISEFQVLLPTEPSIDLITEIRKLSDRPPAKPKEDRKWFVYINDSQYGPFADSELSHLLDSKKINEHTYIWRKGFEDWCLLQDVEPWNQRFTPNAPPQPMERRLVPRKPFEAKILFTDGKEVGWAICRDISLGGMQILMDAPTKEVNSPLKINVTSDDGSLPNFSCDAEVVRMLENNCGFSVRFLSLPDDAKTAIETYLKSN